MTDTEVRGRIRRKSGSPASVLPPRSAKASTPIGRRSNARRINVDEKTFAPYVVHPFAPVNFDTQIPKKGDQRQMEAWQRIGTYAAGLALDSAGVKGNKEILVAHGHDRRRRRRRARSRGRRGDPHRACQGQRAARLPQRAADERPAPDAVPGAALQPARRQYRDRAWRDRHPRAPSWARKPPASTPRGSRWRVSPPARATSRWSAARRTASARTCWCSTNSATSI